MKPFGDKNMDVLMGIELEVVRAYRANPAITDFDVTDGLEALTRQYAAEASGRTPSTIALDPRAQDVYHNVRAISEWRMARTPGVEFGEIGKVSLEDTITALRTIMKSIRRWSGRGGKRGYLDFVQKYFP